MTYDVAIIGGGIVGLATGWDLLNRNRDLKIVILEKEKQVATHQTDRNSGVIHSGIYYKPGSAKAINCVKGSAMLIDFCHTHQIPYELCGKVIVAGTSQELPVLEGIYQRGIQNGLTGLKLIDPAEVKEIEPHCKALQGIWVPQAGIVDYRDVAEKLKQLIIQKGGVVMTGFKAEKIDAQSTSLKIDSGAQEIQCGMAIACAGLYSDHIARIAGLTPPHQIVPFRGEFYSLTSSAQHLVKGLIYPVPDINFPFLGVHLTKRIHGGIEAGPNAVFALRREGYNHFDIHPGELLEALRYKGFQRLALKHWRKGMDEMARSFSAGAFLKSLQKLVPDLRISDIKRSRTGVRAQALDKEGNMVDDYVILQQERMIHILNAPSPAATSCLSIGAYIAEMALVKLNSTA